MGVIRSTVWVGPDGKGAGGRAGYLTCDLIGLARMLWVDPEWPVKARKGQDKSILKCSPKCDACMKLVMQGKPAFCPKWKKEKRAEYRALFL
jgi:NADPH2 dehydrogenase